MFKVSIESKLGLEEVHKILFPQAFLERFVSCPEEAIFMKRQSHKGCIAHIYVVAQLIGLLPNGWGNQVFLDNSEPTQQHVQ